MIKLFTSQFYTIENDVNEWLKENEDTGKVEVTKITQSSCNGLGDREEIYITVMKFEMGFLKAKILSINLKNMENPYF